MSDRLLGKALQLDVVYIKNELKAEQVCTLTCRKSCYFETRNFSKLTPAALEF